MVVALGNTGLQIGNIALGTVKLGRNTDVKYPKAFSLPDDAQVIALLETASEIGVNLLDTAPAYGDSERRLGQLMPGKREQWVISTKCGESYHANGSHYDFSASAIGASVEQSLKHLNTDYLDIVLIHSNGNDSHIIEHTDAVETLLQLKQKGLIRAIGMSTKTVAGGLLALAFADVLMVTLNLDDDSQMPVIDAANNAGTGILLKKVFASGHRAPEDSLRYALGTQGVHAAVVGTLNPEHLRSNVRIAIDL